MHNFTLKALFGLAIFAATAVVPAWAESQIPLDLPSFLGCESSLTNAPEISRELLRKQYLQFRHLLLPHDMGFKIDPVETGDSNPRTLAWYGISNFDEILNTQIWRLDSSRYQFIDVGFKNMEADSRAVNAAVLEHIMKFPTQTMHVEYRIRRFLVESLIENYRWALHAAVLKKYLDEKSYLTTEDMAVLTELNTLSDNSDVFGILQYDPQFPHLTNFSNQEIEKRVLLTIQITYHGNYRFLWPTFKGVAAAAGLPPEESQDWFPFEYRIRTEALAAFRKKFNSRFDVATACEVIRYVNFNPFLPTPIRDGVLLRVFRTAEARGMKTILASADKATARRFSRYGFQIFAKLPTEQTKEPEYLIFLEVDSPEFRNTVNTLAQNSSRVGLEQSGTD